MNAYRTNDPTMARLHALELVRETAEAFLYALDTDPGYPMRRQEAMRAALESARSSGKGGGT